MDEMQSSPEYQELSVEDLAILQAFDEMVEWNVPPIETAPIASTSQATVSFDPNAVAPSNIPLPFSPTPSSFFLANDSDGDEMLELFIMEANEDIAAMRQGLLQLEQDESFASSGLVTLQRVTHKLKGTSGSIGYTSLSRIAEYIESVIALIKTEAISYLSGGIALVQAVQALEETLQGVIESGEESSTPLTELEIMYTELAISPQFSKALPPARLEQEEEDSPMRRTSASKGTLEATVRPFMRVDVRRFEQMVLHTEQLAELCTPLESSQAQVEKALAVLHTAQERLQQVEMVISTLPMTLINSSVRRERKTNTEERPVSSLVARILDEADQRTAYSGQRKPKIRERDNSPHRQTGHHSSYDLHRKVGEPLPWDELEIDHYTERDVLLHVLSEAVADVTMASAQVRSACVQLNTVVQKQTLQATMVRGDALLLRLAPLSTLIPRLARAITMSAIAQQRRVTFSVQGETVEVDQDILEGLRQPLLHLIRGCMADPVMMAEREEIDKQGEDTSIEHCRVWFSAHSIGNEVMIEVGFSLALNEGVLHEIHPSLALLHGSITARSNTVGGTSFHLRLPRSPGAVRGLLVRVGTERVVVAFPQIERIDYGQAKQYERCSALHTLLGFENDHSTTELDKVGSYLLIHVDNQLLPIKVDEIIGDVELVMKPLAKYLQRPGIAGTAVDGQGNMLLVLDVPTLIRYGHKEQRDGQYALSSRRTVQSQGKAAFRTEQTVLVADDSVFMRQTLRRTLTHAGYIVLEANDGQEAFKLLLEDQPDLLLLDMEMPNMNGYDLLSLLHTHPELDRLKVVILTSRSSEKHRRHAFDLGAAAYLTKPCPQDVLLETLRALL